MTMEELKTNAEC